MSQKSLDELLIVSPVLLFLRRNIKYVCLILFLYYTKGKAFLAAKISISMLLFKQVRKDPHGKVYGPDSQQYLELYSLYNMEVLAMTIAAALSAVVIGMCLVWLTDVMGTYKSVMTREARHMRYWARQEIKSLEKQRRLIASLDSAQELKSTTLKLIGRMEDVILRYEQTATALNPERSTRVRLSETTETCRDLFDEPKLAPRSTKKSRTVARTLKFKPKF